MEFSITYRDTIYTGILENNEINDYIFLDKDPQKQMIDLLTNGYMMSKCVSPSMVSCSCCTEINKFKNTVSELSDLINTGGNSSKNGKLCEVLMGSNFKKKFPNIEYRDTSDIDRSGDAIISVKNHSIDQIMVDFKNYESVIPTNEVNKLIRDLDAQNIHFGILYSSKSKISKKDLIDYEIIDNKLIVFICGEGINGIALAMAIKYLIALYEANVISISDKVYELSNKRVGSQLKDIYNNLLIIKTKLACHINRIKDAREKTDKLFVNLNDESNGILCEMNKLVDESNSIVQENHREKIINIHSLSELIDIIETKIDKKKDIILCKQLLNLLIELDITCYYSEIDNCIHFNKTNKNIGKIKLSKTNITVIFYNFTNGNCYFNSDFEEIKNKNFHILLCDKSEIWQIIKDRIK